MKQAPNSTLQIFEEDKTYLYRFRRILVRTDQWIVNDLLSCAE